MKIKILTPNELGKFEFTKEELERLLKEAYDDGYYDGRGYISSNSSQTTPYWPSITYCNNSALSSTKVATEETTGC
jgi:hypothetical protein